jgi:hypothetical protein
MYLEIELKSFHDLMMSNYKPTSIATKEMGRLGGKTEGWGHS